MAGLYICKGLKVFHLLKSRREDFVTVFSSLPCNIGFYIDEEEYLIHYYLILMEMTILPYPSFTPMETIIIGGWFVIIGYFLILFLYFVVFRYQENQNLFHLGFGIFFLLLGVARAFFLVYDFYSANPLWLVVWWRIGTAVSWAAIFAMILSLAYVIIEEKLMLQIAIALPPLIVSILVIALPTELIYPGTVPTPIAYMAFNYVLLPIYSIVLPLLFFDIGRKLSGPLRRSNFLIGGGFLLYYLGRVLQSGTVVAFLDQIILGLGITIAPLFVFLALILIALGVLTEKQQ